jgi:hypothetical protein
LRDKGCCVTNADCPATAECVGGSCSATTPTKGVCKAKPTTAGSCWTDADCGRLATCKGQSVCGCGLLCILPDKMGTCQSDFTPVDPPITTN